MVVIKNSGPEKDITKMVRICGIFNVTVCFLLRLIRSAMFGAKLFNLVTRVGLQSFLEH